MALQDAQLVSFQQITQILELTDRPGRSGVDGDSAASRKRGGHTQAAEWQAGNRRMAEFVGTESYVDDCRHHVPATVSPLLTYHP
jgi:hypothetical protein